MPSPGRYPYGKLSHYERMRPEDIKVWERYIKTHPNQPWMMDYDVNVGLGRTPLDDLSPELRRDWQKLTSKRIDAVAWADDAIYIIELKPTASLGAVGQVLGYSELWQDIQDKGRRVIPLLIVGSTDPDTDTFARVSGVQIVAVPEPSTRS